MSESHKAFQCLLGASSGPWRLSASLLTLAPCLAAALLVSVGLCGISQAQNIRVDGIALTRGGLPAPGATIAVCGQPATVSTQPCSPLAPLCTSLISACTGAYGGGGDAPNPIQADAFGNYSFYVKQGHLPYTLQFYGSGLTAKVLTDQGGGGSVFGTSVIIGGTVTKQVSGGPELLSLQNSTANHVAIANFVGSEANARFVIDMQGNHEWGPGGATDQNVLLGWSATGRLNLSGTSGGGLNIVRWTAPGVLEAQPRIGLNNDGSGIVFTDGTNPQDVNLYRSTANIFNLATLAAGGFGVLQQADSVQRIFLDNSGSGIKFSSGSASCDVNLSRYGVGALSIDASPCAAGGVGGQLRLSTLVSTVATGTAPLTITSTTPVENLTTVPVTYNAGGTQQTGVHIVIGQCTLGTNCNAISLTGAAAFTNATSYSCVVADETGIFAAKCAKTNGTAITITGNGTDVIDYILIGN